MNFLPDGIVVFDIAGNKAKVSCGTQLQEVTLARLGFVSEGTQMVRPIADVHDRVALVGTLIEIGALFPGGRDWSPSEIVDLYKEQGQILTGYRMITWKSPTEYWIWIVR